MSSSCEMCGRNGTRCTSRGCVWPTLSGTSRPTCQKPIQSQLFARRYIVELRNAWQEWDAVHIARVRLANRKRDPASDLTKAIQSPRLFLANMDFLVVDAAKCAAGVGRGALRALDRLSPTMQNERQKRGAAYIARGIASRRRCSMRGRNRTRRMSRAVRLAAHDVR